MGEEEGAGTTPTCVVDDTLHAHEDLHVSVLVGGKIGGEGGGQPRKSWSPVRKMRRQETAQGHRPAGAGLPGMGWVGVGRGLTASCSVVFDS